MHVHCLVCGAPVVRRWWQRGLLRPLPLCRHKDGPACHRRSLYFGGPS